MRVFLLVARVITVLAASVGQFAHAQGSAVYIATYVDVMPNSVASGAALLKKYRQASRQEDGNLRFDVLQELGRPNRFVIFEMWKDKAALDAHGRATSAMQFRDKLKGIENAPYDERVSNGLYIWSAKNESKASLTYVLTHVDVTPPNKDDCLALLKAMSTDTAKDSGNISYDVLQQANRSNHFTVVEAWRNRKALDAHAMAAHTRSFREKLGPMAGALYDERFYKALG